MTGDEVSHGKPHPEPYLTAAARLGVDPSDCLALEDSPTGVTSAAAAGCRVVAIPHIADIDVLEVYNARLLFEAYNDEALRFQRKYGLLAGAGSDAHVLQGVGTGALRMRRFNGPEEFLLSLSSAEVLRRLAARRDGGSKCGKRQTCIDPLADRIADNSP